MSSSPNGVLHAEPDYAPTTLPDDLGLQDGETVQAFRAALVQSVAGWRLQYRQLHAELQSRLAFLRMAQISPLQAGRYKGVRNPENGGVVDFHQGGVNEAKFRCGQLTLSLQSLELSIRMGQEELARLPEPESAQSEEG